MPHRESQVSPDIKYMYISNTFISNGMFLTKQNFGSDHCLRVYGCTPISNVTMGPLRLVLKGFHLISSEVHESLLGLLLLT